MIVRETIEFPIQILWRLPVPVARRDSSHGLRIRLLAPSAMLSSNGPAIADWAMAADEMPNIPHLDLSRSPVMRVLD
jgi:hypothetical protein